MYFTFSFGTFLRAKIHPVFLCLAGKT